MVLSARHVCSSATPPTNSLPNMFRQYSTTTQSLSCKTRRPPSQTWKTLPAASALRVSKRHVAFSALPPCRPRLTPNTTNLRGVVTSLTSTCAKLGSAMSRTHWDCSILPVKKTTTDCGPYHTHRPMSSSSASASPPPHRSKTSARNGSPRSTTTALAYLASLSEHRLI